MNNKEIEKLFKILGISAPENIELFKEAITHKTYTNENKNTNSYEKLEFLGDSILQFKSSIYIYKKFPDVSEGVMTTMRAKNVSCKPLAKIVMDNKINEFLICSNQKNDLINNEKICSDLFESIVAAAYLTLGDQGVEKILEKFIYPEILKTPTNENELKDPKSRLQEHLQPIHKKGVEYHISQHNSSDSWIATATCDGKTYGRGYGTTKKEAESQAAENALEKMKI